MNFEKPFLLDDKENLVITYGQLFSVLNQPAVTLSRNIMKQGPAGVFMDILISLVCDQPVTVFDEDFSDEEIGRLTGSGSPVLEHKSHAPLLHPSNPGDFLIMAPLFKNWTITLFTSGTTGAPKKISHTFSAFIRAVKSGATHGQDVWGFAFNPTHMAGLQVFFQAFLNGNTLVNLFNRDRSYIFTQIEKYQVSHLSATPTFFRLLLPFEQPYPSLRQLTSGGEKFSEKISTELNKLFPHAKITNVYASTEAGSLFATDGESFTVKETMLPLIKITDNELLIHKSLTGFSESIQLEGEWYHTGDLVEVINENPLQFRFVSRRNEMINVGGYKVNPHEVEDAILLIEGITEVRVFAKANSVLGNILCCEVISKNTELSEHIIRTKLDGKLQDYKIPRIIRFVTEIKTSRTGKKTRL